jgi:glycosyltransferase involved in cell wall biosynthesis
VSAETPRRIAHILPFPAVGGTEQATLRIVRAAEPYGFAGVAFVVDGAAAVARHFDGAGVPCVTYCAPEPSYRHALRFLGGSWALARELRRRRIDLVHCADLLAASHAAVAARIARIPVVCHIRNRFNTIPRRDRAVLRVVDRFAFVSRDTWLRFGYRVGADRGRIVYDGLDVPDLAGATDDARSVRTEFGIPQNAPIVGMVARVAPQKDFETLARAAVRVLAAQPATRFLIAGDFSSAETYRAHYARVQQTLHAAGVAPAFVFAGHRCDVPRLMNAFDVFVLSTHWEGLPLVLLEAMARARPVVATSVDGIPEVVENGRTGWLYPHEDDRALARHLIDLLDNPAHARRLGAAGRAVIETRFGQRQFAESIVQLYTSVLGAPADTRAATDGHAPFSPAERLPR